VFQFESPINEYYIGKRQINVPCGQKADVMLNRRQFIQLYSYTVNTVIQLYSLYSYTVNTVIQFIQLYSYTVMQLYSYTVI